MSLEDRTKWDARYADAAAAASEPSPLLAEIGHLLPASGRAIDLAGGAGRHSIWLAERGFDVTLADISPVGLEIARQRAAQAGVSVRTQQADLRSDPPPAGPWDLILSFLFLWRPLLAEIHQVLAPGGILVFTQPTVSNLQRHKKPPRDFLLEDGELPKLIRGLETVHYAEGWTSTGRHDAVLVARRPA